MLVYMNLMISQKSPICNQKSPTKYRTLLIHHAVALCQCLCWYTWAQYSVKRVVYSVKRALCSTKKALYYMGIQSKELDISALYSIKFGRSTILWIYICIYIYIHTHVHTHIYMYIYIYIYMYIYTSFSCCTILYICT